MDHLEPGMIFLTNPTSPAEATITAVAPVNRDALQAYIANVRQAMFHGVQVPVKVTHVDPQTGEEWLEQVPGCATCSI